MSVISFSNMAITKPGKLIYTEPRQYFCVLLHVSVKVGPLFFTLKKASRLRMSGSRCCGCELAFVGCDAVEIGRQLPTFRERRIGVDVNWRSWDVTQCRLVELPTFRYRQAI